VCGGLFRRAVLRVRRPDRSDILAILVWRPSAADFQRGVNYAVYVALPTAHAMPNILSQPSLVKQSIFMKPTKRMPFSFGFIFLVLTGCSSSSAVQIVLPVNFSGPVWIIEDTQQGQMIPSVGGRYLINVPASGIVRFSSLGPLMRPHSFSARFADGSFLPVESQLPEGSDSTFALRSGGLVSSSRDNRNVSFFAYYVGKRAQAKQFIEMPKLPTD
jgi:hypothetical protein